MANHGEEAGQPATDNKATYEGFLTASKWGVIVVALVLIVLAIFFG